MSNRAVADQWFEACEASKGCEATRDLQAEAATFSCEAFPEITVLDEYVLIPLPTDTHSLTHSLSVFDSRTAVVAMSIG
jgi:hypothetical protein